MFIFLFIAMVVAAANSIEIPEFIRIVVTGGAIVELALTIAYIIWALLVLFRWRK